MRLLLPALFLTVVPMLTAQSPTPAADPVTRCVTALANGTPAERDAAIAAAAGLGTAAVAPIGALLQGPPPREAAAAARATAALRALAAIAAAEGAPGRTTATATAAALLDLLALQPPLPPVAAGEVLRQVVLLAADEATAQRVSEQLDQPERREAALAALQQMQSPGADAYLLGRLGHPGAVPRIQIVQALGARRLAAAAPRLLDLLPQAAPIELPAIRRALAAIGDPAAQPVLLAALQEDPTAAGADWLLFLDRRRALGAPSAELQAQWRGLLAHPAADLRAAAVAALAGSLDDLPVVSAALGDDQPAVRAVAVQVLLAWPGIDEALLAAHLKAMPAIRAGLLQVLAGRQHPRTLGLSRAGALHTDAGVRATAVRVLAACGEPGDDETLFTSCADPEAVVRTAAAEALLVAARRRIAADDRIGALRLLHRLATGAAAMPVRCEAVLLCARLALPESLPILEMLATEPQLREAVFEARLAIAGKLDGKAATKAVELLADVYATTTDRGRRAEALRQLQRRSPDAGPWLQARGCVRSWQVLGPWAKAKDDADLATLPFDAAVDVARPLAHGDQQLRWVRKQTEDADGVVDLTFLQPHEQVSAFAFCRFELPAATDLVLALGSDDGIAVFVDGKCVHHRLVARGVTVDEDKVPLQLQAGGHSLLLRVDQGAGDFAFCLRTLDTQGRPLLLRILE